MKHSIRALIASAVAVTLAGAASTARAEEAGHSTPAAAEKNACKGMEKNACKGMESSMPPSAVKPGEREMCYGVVKAGKNDCASADGKHACAGQTAADGDPSAFVYTPQGLCDRLAGGSLTPPEKK